jgi:aspartate/methionine/tyrosine aminotransferase
VSDHFSFAQRTGWPLTANKLSADLECLRQAGAPVLDLTASNPTRCGFSYPHGQIQKALEHEEILVYSPAAQGDLKAREAVSRYYQEKGVTVSPEQIFLTSSTSEAYSYLFRLLADPGERVLFPCPSYPLFSFLGDLNDVRVDTYPLVYDGRWSIDIEGVRRAVLEDTKALVLVNPNNPTGSFVLPDEVEELNRLCAKRNIALISDEVFADFGFDQNVKQVSLVNNDPVLTFVLGGISKTLALPQMKISWIILSGPAGLAAAARARLEVIADTFLSVGAPAQNALARWMSCRQEIQQQIRARLLANLDFLKSRVKRAQGCEVLVAEGGWYATLRIPVTRSEEEWVLAFLNEDHVFVHPGYFFDFDLEGLIVVSLLPAEDVFQEGVRRILTHVEEAV